MNQGHLLPEPNEPMTDLEVRALVERFGERQTMAHGQPTVRDVAEALQVDPATVGRMLLELRESKNQDEIKQRLDRLERENAELRERGERSSPFHAPFPDARIRRPFLISMILAIVVVQLTTKRVFAPGDDLWFKQFIAIACVAAVVFALSRVFFRRKRD